MCPLSLYVCADRSGVQGDLRVDTHHQCVEDPLYVLRVKLDLPYLRVCLSLLVWHVSGT